MPEPTPSSAPARWSHSKREDVEGTVSVAQEAFGSVDILVNNSGATWGATPTDMPL